jgi:photosystem II stability/assembly factor-like uncharacterized protein
MTKPRSILLLLLAVLTYGMVPLAAQVSYESVRDAYQRAVERPSADGKPTLNKQFRRWEWFWQGRLLEDGTFPSSDLYLKELQGAAARKTTDELLNRKTWKEVGPIAPDMPSELPSWSGIGRVNCIDFSRNDPTVMYAGSAAGGLWKTTNSGSSWQPIHIPNIPVVGISDIAVAPSNDNVIYVATGDVNGSIPGQLSRYNGFSYGIIKSTDAGATWQMAGLASEPADNSLIGRLWVDPRDANVVVAATYGGMYRTTDGGLTWTRSAQGIFRELIGNPVSIPTLYAASYGFNGGAAVYRSTDAGKTWSDVYTIGRANRIRLAVTKANQNVVVALASNADDQGLEGIFKSTDAGTTFAELPTTLNLLGWSATGNDQRGQGFYDLALEISPTNANHLFVGGINIWRTTTNGSRWELSAHWTGDRGAPYVHADQHFFKYHPTRNHLFATHDGGIARSTDGGITWRDVSRGLAIQQYYGLATSNQNAAITLAGSQDNGTALTRNSGATFSHVLGGDGMLSSIDVVSPSIMYGSSYYGNFWRSSNGGSSWSFVSSSDQRGEAGSWVAPICVDPRLQNTVYVGYQQVWKSTNAGQSWAKISNISSSVPARIIAVAPSNPNFIFVAYNTALYFTTNGGQTWQQQTGLNGFIMGIEVDPTTPNKYYVAIGGFSQGQKVMMVNAGVVTNITGSGLPNLPCNSLAYQRGTPNRLFAGTDIGVYVMDEGTGFWQSYGSGLPPVIVTGMRLIPSSNLLRISTYGRGIWEVDVAQCAAVTPSISAVTPTTICTGDSVILEASSGYASYRWSNGDTTRRIVLKSTSQSGTYLVGVEDTKGCRAVSAGVNVVISRLPSKPLITKIARDTLRSSAFGGVSKFQWSLDGSPIAGATGRNLAVSRSGVYRVSVTDSSCSNTSDEFQFTYEPAVSIDDRREDQWQLVISPNPVNESFTIALPGSQEVSLVIMDLSGRTVFTSEPALGATSLNVNASGWSSGLFLAQVRSGNGVWTTSFVKK